jgi:hypothetical protein
MHIAVGFTRLNDTLVMPWTQVGLPEDLKL